MELDAATVPQLRASLGGLKRRGRPDDDPDVIKAREALALARTERRIREAIEQAPPLSAETIEKIRALLPAPRDGVAAA
ncbi:hypothetical protein RB614_19745 [Phytohabitans sp. ZYX-F-186]|uniref:Uncharacterized protein n=1 Tax=Phytohabitans maris TaxID=3071409 RepID=A0ABU0ZI74_9ACTN|nr:hypothetical protein [Phytohabitans sp. ZYX-F-186]MDQ7906753.1 hypothetical protein [Phytohabitans sp. ZYX-F-186]